jgi:hypothetical protein
MEDDIYIYFTYIPCILLPSKFLYSPTDAQVNCLKNNFKILKFTLKLTLKQLLHVSVQSPSSGSALFKFAKVTVVKIIII